MNRAAEILQNSLTGLEPVLTETQALAEANRCLQCYDPPCARNCPAGVGIPSFIRMIRSHNYQGAAEVFRTANPLAFSCSLSCPDDELCGAACTRARLDSPLQIRQLHRFAIEFEAKHKPRHPKPVKNISGKVAIVGAGPAGLACASELKQLGYKTVIFEQNNRPGGVPADLIPLERMPHNAIRRDVNRVLDSRPLKVKQAVKLHADKRVTDLEALCAKYDAVFVAPGLAAAASSIPGSDLKGVISAHDFLRLSRQRKYRNAIGKRIVVIGGGNVAVDAAGAAALCGLTKEITPFPDIRIIYRRTRSEMPAWQREISSVEEIGVAIEFLLSPISFVGDGKKLTGIKLIRTTLSASGVDGRPVPVPVPGSEFVLPCDQAILAMGMQIDRAGLSKLPYTNQGDIRVNANTLRVKGNLFAGGDAVGSDQTIVAAVRDGKRAARSIAAELKKRQSK